MGGGGNDSSRFIGTCCNDPQLAFCTLYVAFLVIVFLSWKSYAAKPMRLIAVFVHEMSHATMCWLTCGNVRGIEVYHNEGGVTRYVGGCRCLIIPAGYLGTGFWGMVLVIMSGGRRTATLAAAVFTFALLVSLCYSPNRTMVYLNLGYAVITLALIFVEWYVFSPVLQFVILLYGVFIGTYAIFDIFDDLIARTVQGSDAYACYEIAPCCLPRCVGIQWAMFAVLFQFFGLWMALVLMSDECYAKSWTECVGYNLPEFEKGFQFWDGKKNELELSYLGPCEFCGCGGR